MLVADLVTKLRKIIKAIFLFKRNTLILVPNTIPDNQVFEHGLRFRGDIRNQD